MGTWAGADPPRAGASDNARMSPELRLSVLDQSVACVGRPQDESIRNTVTLAEHCERLGYQRFWLSEHHSLPAIVGTAPEVLMAGRLWCSLSQKRW